MPAFEGHVKFVLVKTTWQRVSLLSVVVALQPELWPSSVLLGTFPLVPAVGLRYSKIGADLFLRQSASHLVLCALYMFCRPCPTMFGVGWRASSCQAIAALETGSSSGCSLQDYTSARYTLIGLMPVRLHLWNVMHKSETGLFAPGSAKHVKCE